jgi:hypothetical protein
MTKTSVSFYSGCSSSNVKIKNDSLDLFLDLYDDEGTWDKNLPLIKNILTTMTQTLATNDIDQLKVIYRSFVEHNFKEVDYNKPIQECDLIVIERILSFINGYDLKSLDSAQHQLLSLVETYLSVLHQVNLKENKSSYCEQCGDTNYSYEVNINL